MALPHYGNATPAGFAVSRDGRLLLYDSLEAVGEDIMLVENFR